MTEVVQLFRTVDGNSSEKLMPPPHGCPTPSIPMIPRRENPACLHPRVAQREQGWGLWLMMWINCSWVFLALCYTAASRYWRRELSLFSWLIRKTPDLGAYSLRRKTLNGNPEVNSVSSFSDQYLLYWFHNNNIMMCWEKYASDICSHFVPIASDKFQSLLIIIIKGSNLSAKFCFAKVLSAVTFMLLQIICSSWRKLVHARILQ